MNWLLRNILAIILMAALGACAANRQSGSRYSTVDPGMQGDSERARELNRQAIDHIERGELAEAERLLKTALEADLMYGPAHNNLGRVYYQQKRLYLAAWEFEYAIKLMPNQSEPKNNLGLVFEAVGKLNEAVEQYDRALALEPDNPILAGNLARARIRRGDRGQEMRELLRDLIMKDTRAEWIEWAQQTLATQLGDD